MIQRLPISTSHWKVGITGLVWGLLSLLGWVWLAEVPAPVLSGTEAQQLLEGLLTSFFLTGMGWYLYQQVREMAFYQPLTPLVISTITGSLSLAALLLPLALAEAGWANLLPVANHGLAALQLTFIALFLLSSTFLLLRLVAWQHRPLVHRWAVFFLGALLANNLLHFDAIHQSSVLWAALLLMGAVPVCLLTTRMQWLTAVPKEKRWVVLGFLGLLLLQSGALVYFLYTTSLLEVLGTSLLQNGILLLTAGFVGIFAVVNSLGLLVYLPLAPAVDAQRESFTAFRHIHEKATHSTSIAPVLEVLLHESIRHIHAASGWLAAFGPDVPEGQVVVAEDTEDNDARRIMYTLQHHPRHYGLESAPEFIYIKDLRADPFLKDHLLSQRSLLCCNLRLPEGAGLYRLFLLHPHVAGFDRHDTQLISAFVQQATQAISHLMLLEEATLAQQYRKDIAIGRQVQQRLLPTAFSSTLPITITATSRAAEEVGGDYYDYQEFGNQQMALLMADVSGKGTTAAFHVAEMKGIFQSLMLGEPTPAEFLKKANEVVGRCFDKGMFITLVYGVLDWPNKTFRYIRAGHCPLIHYRASDHQVLFLEDDGLGLGIIRDESYDALVQEHSIAIAPGDALVFYTDGITEARHPETKKEFGYERLRDALMLYMDLPADKVVTKIIQEVHQFTAQPGNRDDMSIMIVKC